MNRSQKFQDYISTFKGPDKTYISGKLSKKFSGRQSKIKGDFDTFLH